jgi:glutamyl-tRNA reductase
MSVVAVGLHERDVELDLLASVAISDSDLPKALSELAGSPHLSEVVIVSTCHADRGLRRHRAFPRWSGRHPALLRESDWGLDWLRPSSPSASSSPTTTLLPAICSTSPPASTRRCSARERFSARYATPPSTPAPSAPVARVLDGMFRHAVEVGKRSRSETSIARGITSLSHVAVELVSRHYDGDLDGRRVVVIGAGEMGAGITAALFSAGSPEVVVANRTASRRAARLEHGARAVSLAEIPTELADVDVVISAVTSDQPVLTVAAVRAAREISDAPAPRDRCRDAPEHRGGDRRDRRRRHARPRRHAPSSPSCRWTPGESRSTASRRSSPRSSSVTGRTPAVVRWPR